MTLHRRETAERDLAAVLALEADPDVAGLGAAAVELALDRAFAAHDARRVWLDVLPDNLRALRLYERAGLACDGVLPGAHLLPDGSRVPLVLMSTDRAPAQ